MFIYPIYNHNWRNISTIYIKQDQHQTKCSHHSTKYIGKQGELRTYQHLGIMQDFTFYVPGVITIRVQSNKSIQFYPNFNNIIRQNLLHVSALVGPSDGSKQQVQNMQGLVFYNIIVILIISCAFVGLNFSNIAECIVRFVKIWWT